MNRITKHTVVVLACLPSPLVFALGSETPQLSERQSSYLEHQIQTQLNDTGQRSIVKEWSVEKQIAEFICKPAALKEVRKTASAAEKVLFLDDASGAPLRLTHGVLTGSAQYREGIDWQKFEYTCRLEDNGHLRSFTVKQ